MQEGNAVVVLIGTCQRKSPRHAEVGAAKNDHYNRLMYQCKTVSPKKRLKSAMEPKNTPKGMA